MRLKDKVAVITGAGSGIGQGTALRFSKEGAKVVILDFDFEKAKQTEKLIVDNQGDALALKVDVSKKAELEDAVEIVLNEYSRIDIWINAAGIAKIIKFLDCTEELWQQTVDVNLTGMFYACQIAVEVMLKNGGGNIVNFSSITGKKGSDQYAPYCATKFGVIGLTESVALEFADKNIRCNAICPGIVLTPMWDQQKIDYSKKRNIPVEDVMPTFASRIPMKRLCEMEEITNVLLFLVTDDSSYMTGQAINVTGGEWRK